MKISGLFAGIGGIEHGLHSEGFESILLCENDQAAMAVYPENSRLRQATAMKTNVCFVQKTISVMRQLQCHALLVMQESTQMGQGNLCAKCAMLAYTHGVHLVKGNVLSVMQARSPLIGAWHHVLHAK